MMKKLLPGLISFLFMGGISASSLADTISYSETYDIPDILLNASANNKDKINDVRYITFEFDITGNSNYSLEQTFNSGIITLVVEDDNKGKRDGVEFAEFTYEGQKSNNVVSAPAIGNTGKKKRSKKSASTILAPTSFDINSSYWSSDFIVDASAFSDGIVTVKIAATMGDFWFRSAQLTVTSSTPTVVPPGDLPAGAGAGSAPLLSIPTDSSGPLGSMQQGDSGGVVDDGPYVVPVPEPMTMLLFGTGMVGLAAIGRRKAR